MKKLPDYCDFLTPSLIAAEDIEWNKERLWKEYARQVRMVKDLMLDRQGNRCVDTVLEVGCGGGYVANELDLKAGYLGVDGNPDMVKLAISKFPEQNFVCTNIRTMAVYQYDLVCSFAVLKHFSLDELPEIVKAILRCGKFGLLQFQVAKYESHDTGTHFHHTFVSSENIHAAIKAAGHKVEYTIAGRVCEPNGFECSFVTRRILDARV